MVRTPTSGHLRIEPLPRKKNEGHRVPPEPTTAIVIYLGYASSSQMTCLGLMARKIMVSQSTSGDVPESGLDVLNQDGDSVEVALARQLVH